MTSFTVPNTFTASTVIASSEMNANFTAVATAFAASLGIDGAETMTGTFKAASGTAALPGITFGADLNSGIFSKAADTLGFSVAGSEIGNWDASNLNLLGGMTLAAALSLTASSPKINLTDSDTGADHSIDADNSSGSMVYSADLNNEVANSTHVWALDGTNQMALTAAALTPAADDGKTLGTTALQWADLFLASGAVINFNNGDATITHSAGAIDIAVTSLTQNGNPIAVALPFVQGLVITNNSATPTTSLDVDADNAIIADTSNTPLLTGAVNLTIDATTTGANGLDTGSLANNTWYYIYIISNGSTIAGLLSASATSPTMPSGYTYKYRVGSIRTRGSATFDRVRIKGNQAQYEVVTSSVTPNLPILQSGGSGSVTIPTWTAVAISSGAPPTATAIDLVGRILNDNSDLIVAPNNNYGAINSASNPPPIAHRGNNGFDSQFTNGGRFRFILESSNIYYAARDGDATTTSPLVACAGWVDSVNAC